MVINDITIHDLPVSEKGSMLNEINFLFCSDYVTIRNYNCHKAL